MDELSFIHQIGIRFHIDTIRKQPQLSAANEVIIEMGSSDEHIFGNKKPDRNQPVRLLLYCVYLNLDYS